MSQSIIALAQTAAKQPLERLTLPALAAPTGYEVDVAVHHCSVCHSDLHLVDGDWGDVKKPLIPGHEIVGTVLRQGPSSTLRPGALVGIGWQAGSCGGCPACRTGREHLCTGGKQRTCVGRQGGFATEVRVDARFAFELPEGLDARTAAPLLCAGLTVFSPLERFKVGPGVRVGVVGVGGLGHMAVQLAKALGAEVLGFDPDLTKRDLALKLGASDLVDARGPLPAGVVDLLLVTTHANLDWNAWMGTLDLEGHPLPHRRAEQTPVPGGGPPARRAEARHRQRHRQPRVDARDALPRRLPRAEPHHRAPAHVAGQRRPQPRARRRRPAANRPRQRPRLNVVAPRRA
jgi:D-arabinose 1-dehydrogenase-like Zn-dependent alcohol dehydrogenase